MKKFPKSTNLEEGKVDNSVELPQIEGIVENDNSSTNEKTKRFNDTLRSLLEGDPDIITINASE